MAERYSGGRPDMKYVERKKLTYVDYKCSRTVQYLGRYISIGSKTIAYIIMTMHDIVFSINIAGGDVGLVVQGVLRLAPPTRPFDERPPVMHGHFLPGPKSVRL